MFNQFASIEESKCLYYIDACLFSVPRSKVSMNSAQATELFRAFGKVRAAPQSCGKADVSLGMHVFIS